MYAPDPRSGTYNPWNPRIRSTATLDDLKIDRSREKRSSYAWVVWLLLFLLVASGGGLAAWRWWTDSQIAIVRTALARQTMSSDGQPTVLNATGYVTARLQSTVSSKVTGRIIEVPVEEGMAIREGQVLARLDDTTERSCLALAEAQLAAARGALVEFEVRHAEATLDRKRQLLDQGIIGRAEFDTAQAEADSLEALTERFGSSRMTTWRYGDEKFKHALIRHPMSGAVNANLRRRLDVRPLPRGGYGGTVHNTGNGDNQTTGASFMIIADTSD